MLKLFSMIFIFSQKMPHGYGEALGFRCRSLSSLFLFEGKK